MSKPIHTMGPWTLESVPYFYNVRKEGLVSGIATIQAVSPSSTEALANGKLIVAAANAFDSAARKLKLNAVELAEAMHDGGIATLAECLRDVLARFHSCIADGNGQIEGDENAIAKAVQILDKVKGGAA